MVARGCKRRPRRPVGRTCPGRCRASRRRRSPDRGHPALAGGRSNPVANRILVVRIDPLTGEQAVIQVNYNHAKDDLTENLLLQPGDMVIVDQTVATTFFDTIRLIGFSIG